MGYIKDMYGSRSVDFIKGFLAAMDTFSVWHDGERHFGSMSRHSSLKTQMRFAVKELSGNLEDHKEQIGGD